MLSIHNVYNEPGCCAVSSFFCALALVFILVTTIMWKVNATNVCLWISMDEFYCVALMERAERKNMIQFSFSFSILYSFGILFVCVSVLALLNLSVYGVYFITFYSQSVASCTAHTPVSSCILYITVERGKRERAPSRNLVNSFMRFKHLLAKIRRFTQL